MTRLKWSLALLSLGFGVPFAHAGPFSYPDFSSTAGLQLNGSAFVTPGGPGSVLRLTPSAPGQGGSAFTTTAESLGGLASFSTYFQFRLSNSGGIGDEDGQGADGIVFVVQTVSNNVGSTGGGIGYQGIGHSLGIEFDTYHNSEPDGNHVGIDTNGAIDSGPSVHEPTRFNNGDVWNAWVDYDGSTGLLEVRWSQSSVRPVAAGISGIYDLPTILGQNNAFLGFTAATGSGYNDQDILDWQFRDSYNPIDTAAPEPASIISLAGGVICLFGYGRRRKAATV
jgi:hypothetical protein